VREKMPANPVDTGSVGKKRCSVWLPRSLWMLAMQTLCYEPFWLYLLKECIPCWSTIADAILPVEQNELHSHRVQFNALQCTVIALQCSQVNAAHR
jgi:hypothetical protein